MVNNFLKTETERSIIFIRALELTVSGFELALKVKSKKESWKWNSSAMEEASCY